MFTRTIVNYIRVIFGGNTFSNSLLKRIKGLLQPSGSKEMSQGVSSLKVAMFYLPMDGCRICQAKYSVCSVGNYFYSNRYRTRKSK